MGVDEVAPERIEVEEGLRVTISWANGDVSRFDAAELRAACQCADCREPSGRSRTEQVLNGPEPVTITDAKLVGNYAINFVFAPDAHGTGIFPFIALHELGAGR